MKDIYETASKFHQRFVQKFWCRRSYKNYFAKQKKAKKK